MLSTWRKDIVDRRRTAATLLVLLIAIVTLAGCSLGCDEDIAFSEDYLKNVLSMDFYGMGDMLWEEGSLSDYEIDNADTGVMKAILSESEFEQRDFISKDGKVTVEYILKLPDYKKLGGKRFDDYDEFIEFASGLDTTSYHIDITVVSKKDSLKIEDADSTVALYGEIMENIRQVEVKGALCSDNVSEVVNRYLPETAAAIREASVRNFSDMDEINVTSDGVQVIIQEYRRENDAYGQYVFLVSYWCGEEPARDEYYHGLNANGRASGIICSEHYVVHIYDIDGRHSDEVCSILSDLSELI